MGVMPVISTTSEPKVAAGRQWLEAPVGTEVESEDLPTGVSEDKSDRSHVVL